MLQAKSYTLILYFTITRKFIIHMFDQKIKKSSGRTVWKVISLIKHEILH